MERVPEPGSRRIQHVSVRSFGVMRALPIHGWLAPTTIASESPSIFRWPVRDRQPRPRRNRGLHLLDGTAWGLARLFCDRDVQIDAGWALRTPRCVAAANNSRRGLAAARVNEPRLRPANHPDAARPPWRAPQPRVPRSGNPSSLGQHDAAADAVKQLDPYRASSAAIAALVAECVKFSWLAACVTCCFSATAMKMRSCSRVMASYSINSISVRLKPAITATRAYRAGRPKAPRRQLPMLVSRPIAANAIERRCRRGDNPRLGIGGDRDQRASQPIEYTGDA